VYMDDVIFSYLTKSEISCPDIIHKTKALQTYTFLNHERWNRCSCIHKNDAQLFFNVWHQLTKFSEFFMARLKTLQFHLTLTPLFTATHTLFFSLFHHFFSWSVIGVFGLFSCDPRFMAHIDSPWFVKFSKMANINFRESWFGFFFINWDLWAETPPALPPRIS
jgi:hypothetical protein